mmetsp:Transcript_38149/g.38836  ORF Transcript_38149/g.38836 Transcript_38149/m.38836 type:complete len:208 (-) Transcript_38149:191-814(-)
MNQSDVQPPVFNPAPTLSETPRPGKTLPPLPSLKNSNNNIPGKKKRVLIRRRLAKISCEDLKTDVIDSDEELVSNIHKSHHTEKMKENEEKQKEPTNKSLAEKPASSTVISKTLDEKVPIEEIIFTREDRERIFHGILESKSLSYFLKNPYAYEIHTEVQIQLQAVRTKIIGELKQYMDDKFRQFNDLFNLQNGDDFDEIKNNQNDN